MLKTSIKYLCTGIAFSLLIACTDSNSYDKAIVHARYANEFYKAKNYTKAIDECTQAITFMEQGASSSLNIFFSSKGELNYERQFSKRFELSA